MFACCCNHAGRLLPFGSVRQPSFESTMKNFSDRLESLRGSETQREFAKRIGIPLTSYTNWVLGLRTPNMDALIKICSHSGVSADWLLGLEDRAPPSIRAHNSAVAVNGHAVNGHAPAATCPECAKKDAAISRLERVIDKLTK